MLELEFRPMRVEDLDRVYEIETASFKNCPWPKLAYKREITENRLSDYCVCLYDGRIVAFAGMWSIYEESELTKIATDTSMRRMGIGKRLLLHMMQRARERGSSRMSLEVRVHNEPAKELYRSLGFVEIGIRKTYYPDTREDAIIMANTGLCAIHGVGGDCA